MHPEVKAALKSLPWYLVGSYLITPAACAIFTLGISLTWYFIPFSQLINPHITFLEVFVGTAFVCAPGFLLWLFKRFINAAVNEWKKNHLVRY